MQSQAKKFQQQQQPELKRKRPIPQIKGVVVAGHMSWAASSAWELDNLLGRWVEISGFADTASLTLVTRIVHEAQARRESVAWISTSNSTFFPPDLAANGIDLEALPVVRVEKGLEAARASDALLRSGGFALVVIDLGGQVSMSISVQTRLAGLAKRYHAAVLALTRKEPKAPSLGSLVSLRGACTRKRTAFGCFTCEFEVLKDKRGGPGWRHVEMCRGPAGLC